jgi:hypothetical protein
VVNQLPASLEESLKHIIGMIDDTLLPIVQDFERKSKLDLMIFERVKEVGEMLKTMQTDMLAKDKTFKHYKALSFK